MNQQETLQLPTIDSVVSLVGAGGNAFGEKSGVCVFISVLINGVVL